MVRKEKVSIEKNAKDGNAKGEMDILKQEELFLNILKGKDQVHEIVLSNGMLIKMQQPTNLEVAFFHKQGFLQLKNKEPEIYEELMKQLEVKDNSFDNAVADYYLNLGYMNAVCAMIKPTFDDYKLEVDDDDIVNFITGLSSFDLNILINKYLEIAGKTLTESGEVDEMGNPIMINETQEDMKNFRENTKRTRTVSSSVQGKE